MRRLCRTFFVFCLISVGIFQFFYRLPTPAMALVTPEELGKEIDQFKAAGADAYLVWQFSGDKISPFANDQYSFFKGDQICGVLKEKSAGIKVGVNMWDAGAHDQGAIQSNFQYLKSECGVSIVRVFAYAGGTAGLSTVLQTANAVGIQVIVTIGDYSNGGGGVPKGAGAAWYSAGYKGEYLAFANQVRGVVQGSSSTVYALELANEPHCGGDANAIGAYTAWVKFMAGDLAVSGAPIAIGQMASQDTTRCDSPPDDYKVTNNVSGISKSSAHYYKAEEKINALEAANVAKSIGKTFYIGEANFGGDAEEKRPSFVYPGIEDMAPDVSKMKSMAAGYTLMCGNQFKMQGNIENESALTNRPPGMGIDCSGTPPADYRCTIGGVFANVILDNTKTTIPLYRFQGATAPNPDSATRRMDDLEGFFSANYTKDLIQSAADTTGSQFIKPLANGVSRKLMSDQVQCESTLQYLESIRKLCEEEGVRSSYTYNDKLDADATPLPVSVPKPTLPPGECALYSKIPGGDSDFATYKDIIDKKPGDFSCTNSPPGLVDSKWYKAFQKVEITAPKGFKPAYLVHYIDRPETPQTALDKRVVWQAPGESKNGGVGDDRNISDRIKIVKVYVPAGFAEVNIDEVNKNVDLSASEKQQTFFPTFSGGLMQTITALLPYQVQTEILKTRSLVIRTIERAMDGAIPGGAIKCESCVDKKPDDPRVMIIKRINAGISTSGQDACTKDDLIGQTAAERQHTINPAGTLDPVMPAKITASATMVATKPGSEPETIKTFLLLPEEYRNIAEFEKPFLQTFLPYELQDTTDHPEFQFVSTKSELAKNPKAALKYLQLSGSRADVISPKVPGWDLSYQVPGDYDPLLPPGQSPGPKTINGKLSGQIVADRSTSAILPDPQVPGGILARALWQIMCNVNRSYDKLPTVTYPGFEKFLQKGVAACTDGAKPTETSTSPLAAGSCNYGEAAVDRAIQNAALKYKVPPEMLLGIFQTEGLDYRIAPEKYICKENKGAQAAGVTQVTPGTYNIVTCPNERLDGGDLSSCQKAPEGKISRCDVNGAFELAARVLLWKAGHWKYGICDGSERATAPIRNTNINEVYIAASYYYGSCNADRLTGNFSTGALQRGDILACRDGNCMNMGYGDFVCAFMAKKNGLNYCNRPDNFPSKAQCKF